MYYVIWNFYTEYNVFVFIDNDQMRLFAENYFEIHFHTH